MGILLVGVLTVLVIIILSQAITVIAPYIAMIIVLAVVIACLVAGDDKTPPK